LYFKIIRKFLILCVKIKGGKMEICSLNKIGDLRIPAVKIIPAEYKGIALIIHGYGGCKEEMLGLSYQISDGGFQTYTIDLRGHGENEIPYDENVVTDINLITRSIIEPGKKTVIIGHSLGGRLALLCDCDFSIGISPALNKEYSSQTQQIINNLRGYRVKEKNQGIHSEILKCLPGYSAKIENTKILYGSRDIPEIINKCKVMKELGYYVVTIENALHGDIYVNKKTIEFIKHSLNGWFFN
jgi:hypothetical protein